VTLSASRSWVSKCIIHLTCGNGDLAHSR
jgi:hypothetical protein